MVFARTRNVSAIAFVAPKGLMCFRGDSGCQRVTMQVLVRNSRNRSLAATGSLGKDWPRSVLIESSPVLKSAGHARVWRPPSPDIGETGLGTVKWKSKAILGV